MAERLEAIARLEEEALALRSRIAQVIESHRQANTGIQDEAELQEFPLLDNLISDLPSRARLIEEFKPPETIPGGLTMERILSTFSDEEARLTDLRDRLARAKCCRSPRCCEPYARVPMPAAPAAPPGSETTSRTSPALPHGSPLLHALMELEEHRVVPLRAVWDRKRSEILATLPEGDKSAEALSGVPPEGSVTPVGERAMDRVQEIFRSTSANRASIRWRWRGLYRMGRYAEALDAFTTIPTPPPGMESYLLYHRAACHRELGSSARPRPPRGGGLPHSSRRMERAGSPDRAARQGEEEPRDSQSPARPQPAAESHQREAGS